ncbi:hypothetical protein MKX08_005988 [Trichoderma sp. CBMAI-0020]|nr:hypothetical protein MKX08_005988 [Trichoderma sp. CBMAI-0020]WOD46075.1 hypothetical protein [Trichoderma atroviride]
MADFAALGVFSGSFVGASLPSLERPSGWCHAPGDDGELLGQEDMRLEDSKPVHCAMLRRDTGHGGLAVVPAVLPERLRAALAAGTETQARRADGITAGLGSALQGTSKASQRAL